MGMGITDPCRPCGMSGICRDLGLVVSPATRGLSPPMCVPASPISYCVCRHDSCEGCSLEGIFCWFLCSTSTDDGPPADALVVLRAFASRRLYFAFELMAPIVVVDICVGFRLIGSATHGSLVFACGIRWQRLQLVVRECTG
jgi:hypothetical protein